MIPLLAIAAAVSATLDPSPAIAGNCNPTRVHFSGHITADGPAKVTYSWVHLDHPMGRTYTIEFDKAGSFPVSYELMVRKNEDGAVMLRIVLPEQKDTARVRYRVSCR